METIQPISRPYRKYRSTDVKPCGQLPDNPERWISCKLCTYFANGTLTVTKATPVVTWTNPVDITYGTA